MTDSGQGKANGADATGDWLKAQLVATLRAVMSAHRLSHQEVAILCGFGHAELLALLGSRSPPISTERLLQALARLGVEIEIRFSLGGGPIGEPILLDAKRC